MRCTVLCTPDNGGVPFFHVSPCDLGSLLSCMRTSNEGQGSCAHTATQTCARSMGLVVAAAVCL